MPVSLETLFEDFLHMEEHAASLIDRCCFASGLNAWGMLRTAFTSVFLPKPPGSYIRTHCTISHVLHRQKLRVPDAVLHTLEKVPSHSCLYFSENTTHTMKMGGKAFNPYLDPLAFVAQAAGIMPVKLQLAGQQSGDYLVSALELPCTVEGEWLAPDKVEPFPCFEEYVLLCLEHRVPPLHMPHLLQYCLDIQAYADMFETALARLRPAMVVLICYYSIPQQGLALACSRRGIPCIEYQHGLQTRPHLPYNFTHIPAEGFATVPQWFFTWGENSTLPYQKAFSRQNYHHVATASKPDYIIWKEGRLHFDTSLLELLQQKTEGKKCICVPLSGDSYPLTLLPDLIARSPDDWLWLIREHPLTPSTWLRVPPEYAHKVEYEATTTLPLHVVLTLSQHMITTHSSAALEALSLHNMQTTIIHPAGKEYYAAHIADGSMRYADTLETILHSIALGLDAYPYTSPVEHISTNTKLLPSLLRAFARDVKQ